MYLARDIPAFVMYCVYGASRSSQLIESTETKIAISGGFLNSSTVSVGFAQTCPNYMENLVIRHILVI